MFCWRRTIIPIFLLILIIGTHVWSQDLDGGSAPDPAVAWIAHARDCLKKVYSVRANFLQERISKQGHATSGAKGIVAIRRGNRFRIDYTEPLRQTVVSDGTVVWSYDQRDKTAFSIPVRGTVLPSIFSFLWGIDETSPLRARHIGGALSPKSSGRAAVALILPQTYLPIETVVLTITSNCPGISRVLLGDAAGILTRITLSDVQTNVGIGARWFRFTPPRGTRIVDP